jgi:transposase
MLANVQQATIRPVIEATVVDGALVYSDEYDIYARLDDWGYGHKTVCHARGEYARDEDSDGFCEVHVNTMEGIWSLLRSWLRPHRGISQEKLPLYLASHGDWSVKRVRQVIQASFPADRKRFLDRLCLSA